MQLKVFMAPVENVAAAEAEVNAFLRGHRVLAVKKEFVADGENCSQPRGVKNMTVRKKRMRINWPRPAEDRHELPISLNQSSLL